MKSKKAAVWYYMILLGFILGLASFYYYNALYDPEKESNLNQEIINQLTQRDLEINNIRYYLKKSAEVSAIHSIYSLAENGGYSEDPICGSYSDLSLYQTEKDDLADCRPDITKQLKREFSFYFESYLDNYPEEITHIDNFDFLFQIHKKTKLYGASKEEIILPRKEEMLKTEYENKPFDNYEIVVYAQVECDEKINNEYNVKLNDFYSTEGHKFIFSDVRYPFEGEPKPKDGSDLYYNSQYKETNPNAVISYMDIGNKKGKYCLPLGLNEIYNIQLTTYKDGKEICIVKTAEDNSLWMGKGNFGGYDIRTWSPGKDNNEDDKPDIDCRDSPTYLECPGMRIYYCGKTGWKSFPKRRAEFPGWEQLDSGKSYIDDTFVRVWQGDEPIEERPFEKYLHAKTAAKFFIDFDPEYTNKGSSVKRDTFYRKFVKDKIDYGLPSGKGEAPTYVYKYFRPSFHYELDYNLSDYQYIRKSIQKITDKCSSDDKKLKECVEKILKNLDFPEYQWDLIEPAESKERFFAFQLTTNKKYFPHNEPLTYKFAAYIKDHAPSPIKPGVQSKSGADNSLIISFKMPVDSDIANYNIYYTSEFNLQDKEIQYGSIKEDEIEAKKLTIKAENPISIQNPPTECEFITLGKECQPAIERYKLYLDKDEYMYALLPDLENQEYSIAVTAVDNKGQEINKVENALNIIPKDNLGPGKIGSLIYDFVDYKIRIEPPNTNIDGSELKDEIIYYYFLKQGICDNIVSFDDITKEIDLTNRRSKEDINLILRSAQLGENFCLAVLAADKNGNPTELIREDKVNILRIKPEYSQIFSQLYSSIIIIP